MSNRHVRDKGDRKYYTVIPNIIDDMGLTPYERALYWHLKRVAGENGKCWKSTPELAKHLRMSTGKVSETKAALQKKGLIEITQQPTPHGGRPMHIITIKDVWPENVARYAQQDTD